MADDVMLADAGEIDAPVADVDTVAAAPGADTVEAGGEFKLPDDFDWRTHWAGGDDKALKLAGRYQSPKALLDAHMKLQAKLSSGKVIEPLGEDATDEDRANYRKALDIPAAPEDYLKKLPDGLVVGEDDKPFVDQFLTKMHGANAPQAAANAALDAYYAIVEDQQAAHLEAVANAKKVCEDALREQWGGPGEYRRNENILQNYVSGLPEAVREAFDKGTDPDGMPLGYNPEFRAWLVGKAIEENPIATVVPGAGANQASAIADEIAKWEGMMRDKDSEYWNGPSSDKNRARLRELYEAREKLG